VYVEDWQAFRQFRAEPILPKPLAKPLLLFFEGVNPFEGIDPSVGFEYNPRHIEPFSDAADKITVMFRVSGKNKDSHIQLNEDELRLFWSSDLFGVAL
jgi:hypothetical protein